MRNGGAKAGVGGGGENKGRGNTPVSVYGVHTYKHTLKRHYSSSHGADCAQNITNENL